MSDIWYGKRDEIRERSFDRWFRLNQQRSPLYSYEDLSHVVVTRNKPVFRMLLNERDPRVERVLEILFKVPRGICRGSFLEDATTICLGEDPEDLYLLSIGEYSDTPKILKVSSLEETNRDNDWWMEGEYSMLVNLLPGLLKLIPNAYYESPEEKTAAELKESTKRCLELSHEKALREFEEAENECGRKILKEMGLLKKEEK